MNPPFHFYPKAQTPISIPISSWCPKFLRNRKIYVAIPLSAIDTALWVEKISSKLKSNDNILTLTFHLHFNLVEPPEPPSVELRYLKFICLKISHLPKGLELVQFKLVPTDTEGVPPKDPTYRELTMANQFDHKKYNAHYKYDKSDKLKLIKLNNDNFMENAALKMAENSDVVQEADSCTIPPK
jgi:hypothetical protein